MGIQRALTLYPVNSTTVDTGVGIDIRFLSSTNGGGNGTQTCTAVHTEDNVERTWHPTIAGINAAEDSRTLIKYGWALQPVNDMTPGDDTNCDVVLAAQTVTVSVDVAVGWTGTPLTAANPLWRCGLFQYNPTANTATAIADGSGNAAAAWVILTENGTFKTVTFNVTVPETVFTSGNILLAQFGLNTATLGNPITGTITYTFTYRMNNNTSKVVLASKLVQACALSSSLVGDGVNTRGALETAMSRDLVGVGVLSESRAVVASKSFNLVGDGTITRQLAVAEEKNLVGDGVLSMTRTVAAAKSFDLTGDGTISREALQVGLSRNLVGDGVLDVSKAVAASKTFDLVGEGVITEVHPVQTFRTFNLVGIGEIDGTITIPLDEIPTGDCPSDWSPNDGLKSIAGDVFFHEPPNQGDPVVGATVTLIRDSDGLRITTTVTDAAGHYDFPRDTNDPNTYHVEVTWTDAGGDQQGLSESGCVPA